ncbi:MAG: hypothetical protein H0T73_17325 [Ardenticatenales bacterium]|nr:hypothetical protein [Ardenticatenales bacterium]
MRQYLSAALEKTPRPLNITAILKTLFPMSLWEEPATTEHAAEWLLWLYTERPTPALEPLLRAQLESWDRQAPVNLQRAYQTVRLEEVTPLLEEWLGITASATSWPPFPPHLQLPETLVTKAKSLWNPELTRSEGDFFAELDKRSLPAPLQKLAVQETQHYFQVKPEKLTRERFAAFRPYLSPQQQEAYLHRLPMDAPPDLPETPEDVIDWYSDAYLPYRLWQADNQTEDSKQRVERAAHQFVEWYLMQYPKALAGAPLKEHLAFNRVQSLYEEREHWVTLVVVLDGPFPRDAHLLWEGLQSDSDRLAAAEKSYVFAALPTITEFCKPALFGGVIPARSSEYAPLGTTIGPSKSPLEVLREAQVGQFFFWNQDEPDKVYHNRATSDAHLRRNVEAQIQALRSKLKDLVEQLPAHLPLRLVLTADHGRFYGKSERLRPIPNGMEAHGRAAWGTTTRTFPEEGFTVEDGVAYLHGPRFGVAETLALIIGGEAFHTNDGKQGTERFPHGGLFPEEVVVPWFVVLRDFTQPTVEMLFEGQGVAGQSGTLTIEIINLSSQELIVDHVAIRLHSRIEELKCALTMGARERQTLTFPLASWPTPRELETARGEGYIRLLHGPGFPVPARLKLESKEMYQRNDDLFEDLEL